MKDRIPTKVLENGALRYAVYNESGSLLRHEYMKLDDEPLEEGTALNKKNLLSDNTAKNILRLPQEDPTVDDAFAGIKDNINLTVQHEIAAGNTITAGDVVDIVNGKIQKTMGLAPQIITQAEMPTTGSYTNTYKLDKCVALTDKRFVISYRLATTSSSYLYRMVAGEVTDSGIVFGKIFDSLPATVDVQMVKFNDSSVVCSFQSSGQKVQICNISKDLTITAEDSFKVFASTIGAINNLLKISETDVLVLNTNENQAIYALTIVRYSGGSWSNVTGLYITGYDPTVAYQLSSNRFITCGYCSSSTFYGSSGAYIQVIDIKNNAISTGPYLKINEKSGVGWAVIPIDESHVLYQVGNMAYVATISDNSISVSEGVETTALSSGTSPDYNCSQYRNKVVLKSSYSPGIRAFTIDDGKISKIEISSFSSTNMLCKLGDHFLVSDISNNIGYLYYADLFLNTSSDAIALESGSGGDDIGVALQGSVSLASAKEGDGIHSNGVDAYSYEDGKIAVSSYWDAGRHLYKKLREIPTFSGSGYTNIDIADVDWNKYAGIRCTFTISSDVSSSQTSNKFLLRFNNQSTGYRNSSSSTSSSEISFGYVNTLSQFSFDLYVTENVTMFDGIGSCYYNASNYSWYIQQSILNSGNISSFQISTSTATYTVKNLTIWGIVK